MPSGTIGHPKRALPDSGGDPPGLPAFSLVICAGRRAASWPRGPFQGPRGPFKGPRGPIKGLGVTVRHAGPPFIGSLWRDRVMFNHTKTSRRSGRPGRRSKNVSAVARGVFSRGGFWIWLKIGRFRGLGGPGGLLNHPKRWGAKPPTSLDGLKAPRGRPDPDNDRFSAKS